MNKRKILSLTLGLCMVAILAVGGTLAYFVDTDAANNVFTTGNVTIELIENFVQNSKLLPSTGSAQAGTLQNGVKKEVSVKNTGSEEAYVRVHIAIPQVLDDGAETFDASANLLHFNFDDASVGAGKWDWSKTTGEAYTGDWNYYEKAIATEVTAADGTKTKKDITYNVYVVTYGSKLASGAETAEKAMHQVYLDSEVTNEDIQKLIAELGVNWEIKVVAEGAQATGFADAYAALNEAFGVPGTYDVEWAE